MEFTIDVRWRGGPPDPAWHPWAWEHRRSPTGDLPDELFRAGVEFADGSKATTLDAGPHRSSSVVAMTALQEEAAPPEESVLLARGGTGGGQRWSQSLWLWPLPREGPLSFVCEWPALGIGLSRAAVDAALIREAAARSRPLWDDRVSP